MSERGDIKKTIRVELERYPVIFAFGYGGKHPFVRIETQDGRSERVTFSESPRVSNLLNIRSDLRRVLRTMQIEPYPDERKEARLGSLGAAMMGAAAPDQITIDLPAKEDVSMAAATITPIKAAPQASPPPAARSGPTHYTKLRQDEVVQLTLLLSQHANIDYAAKTVEYADGWSDERLLEMLRAAAGRELLTLNHIRTFRIENFGTLKSERETEPEGRSVNGHVMAMRRQISDLTTRVQALEDAITAPRA